MNPIRLVLVLLGIISALLAVIVVVVVPWEKISRQFDLNINISRAMRLSGEGSCLQHQFEKNRGLVQSTLAVAYDPRKEFPKYFQKCAGDRHFSRCGAYFCSTSHDCVKFQSDDAMQEHISEKAKTERQKLESAHQKAEIAHRRALAREELKKKIASQRALESQKNKLRVRPLPNISWLGVGKEKKELDSLSRSLRSPTQVTVTGYFTCSKHDTDCQFFRSQEIASHFFREKLVTLKKTCFQYTIGSVLLSVLLTVLQGLILVSVIVFLWWGYRKSVKTKMRFVSWLKEGVDKNENSR